MSRAFPLVTAAICALIVSACECRPVAWRDLGVQCNGRGSFASSGSEQVVLDSARALEDFILRDCLPGEATPLIPDVDFTRDVVVVDMTFSPLDDGTCVGDRTVASVEACVGGVQLLFDDSTDPECSSRPLTASVAVRRRDAQAAFSTVPDDVGSP